MLLQQNIQMDKYKIQNLDVEGKSTEKKLENDIQKFLKSYKVSQEQENQNKKRSS